VAIQCCAKEVTLILFEVGKKAVPTTRVPHVIFHQPVVSVGMLLREIQKREHGISGCNRYGSPQSVKLILPVQLGYIKQGKAGVWDAIGLFEVVPGIIVEDNRVKVAFALFFQPYIFLKSTIVEPVGQPDNTSVMFFQKAHSESLN
jgi:hypothetical protein